MRDMMNYAEFRYYRVRIMEFPLQPHLVGREALLEHHLARVFITRGTGGQILTSRRLCGSSSGPRDSSFIKGGKLACGGRRRS